jgi:CrcB protein
MIRQRSLAFIGGEFTVTAADRAQSVFTRRTVHHRIRRQWRALVAISIGGGFGSVARFLIGEAISAAPGRFPWATFLINTTGCLVLGALNVYLLEVWPPRRYVRPFWAIGFLGGFTTFSAYTSEIRDLLDRGATPLAGGYALGSLAAGLGCVWAGAAAARFLSQRRRVDA